MQTLSEIQALLAQHSLRPKHRLGQNFLHDHNKLKTILAAAAVGPGDVILEVGPGTGALSECLLQAGARLVAVEIDRDLEPILKNRLAPHASQLTLLFDDILESKHELNRLVMTAIGPGPFKLVANLPYQIASPLLVNLALDHPHMSRAVVMIQREVADRLTAQPGADGKEYGALSVLIQSAFEVKRVTTLPPSCFWPAPKIDSAVVQLVRRERPIAGDMHKLAELLHRLFSKRRKQLGSVLGRSTKLPVGIDSAARPESLTVEQFAALCDQLG